MGSCDICILRGREGFQKEDVRHSRTHSRAPGERHHIFLHFSDFLVAAQPTLGTKSLGISEFFRVIVVRVVAAGDYGLKKTPSVSLRRV